MKGLMVGAWGVRISVAIAVVTNFLIWQPVRVAVAPK
jgi:hypothetical protein